MNLMGINKMNDLVDEFITKIAKMRHSVIDAGGRPTTLKISQSFIENMKIFGMDIEIVSSAVMPKGVDMMVIEDKDKLINLNGDKIIKII